MDRESRFRRSRKRGKSRQGIRAVWIAACAAAIVCLGGCSARSSGKKDGLEELRRIREEAELTAETNSPLDVSQRKVLNTYQDLYSQNEDLIGWLIIEGTQIDDPVMWTPDDPEYYGDKGFDGAESQNGLLFLDGASNIGAYGGNLIIYSRGGESGSLFADLQKYEEESFWEDNREIRFDTLYESRIYEIAAVARESDVGTLLFEFTLPDEGSASLAIGRMREAALYDTGIEMTYGDDFLTLADHSDGGDDGRLVIMARRIQ